MCILSVGIPVVIRRTFVPSPIHHFPAHASSESPIYTLHALASLPRPCDRFGDQRRENLLSEIHTSATLLLIALSLACLLSLSPFRPPFFLVPSFVCLFFSFGTFSFPFFFFFFVLFSRSIQDAFYRKSLSQYPVAPLLASLHPAQRSKSLS